MKYLAIVKGVRLLFVFIARHVKYQRSVCSQTNSISYSHIGTEEDDEGDGGDGHDEGVGSTGAGCLLSASTARERGEGVRARSEVEGGLQATLRALR
mmetsp:Transcript_76345/g.153309  ORF Transcript_76345/g.153309 Transcript_76345/m.153309 type:complete len:97 (+) Transcript_76345:204-494(+)